VAFLHLTARRLLLQKQPPTAGPPPLSGRPSLVPCHAIAHPLSLPRRGSTRRRARRDPRAGAPQQTASSPLEVLRRTTAGLVTSPRGSSWRDGTRDR
jgi:hypothetical protein